MWLAAPATLVLGITLGVAVLDSPARASRDHGAVTSGVTVTRFVQRDAAGHVTARGATATLGGALAVRSIPAHPGSIRVATARRGHSVVVSHVRPAVRQRSVTAHR